MRLELALRLLARGKIVKEAASETGYKQPSHFSRDFKRLYGVPPTKTRLLRRERLNLDTK